jgi:hypothetical protein
MCTVCTAGAADVEKVSKRVMQLSSLLLECIGEREGPLQSSDILAALSTCVRATAPLENVQKSLLELEALEREAEEDFRRRTKRASFI